MVKRTEPCNAIARVGVLLLCCRPISIKSKGDWEHSSHLKYCLVLLMCYTVIDFRFSSVQFISVAQSCPTLCDRSTPGLPVHHQLPEFTQTHVHQVSDASQPAISSSVVPFSSCPQSLPVSKSFPMSQLVTWGGHSTGVSALASFLPKNTQGWSPSKWTGWISLQSKELSRGFSNTTVHDTWN